jgi:hypothetical protein
VWAFRDRSVQARVARLVHIAARQAGTERRNKHATDHNGQRAASAPNYVPAQDL